MTQRLEHAAFLENLESKFRLQLDGSDQVELELVEVSERKAARRQEIDGQANIMIAGAFE